MTIYNFNEELPSLGSGPAQSDITFVYNTASGRVKQMTVSQGRYKTVTASTIIAAGSSVPVATANSTNTTSTAGFVSPNEGYVNIQATTSGGMVVLPPTAAGQELVIMSPNLKTTGLFQIQVSSSYGSSSPSFDGTNTIINIGTSNAWGITLAALSTTKWGIAAMTQAQSTTQAAGSALSWSFSTGG